MPSIGNAHFAGRRFSLIGDSRCIDMYSGGQAGALTSHWFNFANALNGHNMLVVANYGISGKRSDEYLNTNFATMLADASDWVIFCSPAVNDISQASGTPYTNANGVSVTISNVAQICAGNIIAAANQAKDAGKRVIIMLEPGSTGFTQAMIGALFELNERLTSYAEGTSGVFIWDPCPILWNPTSSSSAIGFRSGVLSDGAAHYSTLGWYALAAGNVGGGGFAAFISPMLPAVDQRISNINENNTTTPLALEQNPLFNTLTGGTSSGLGTVTGNVPAGHDLKLPLASTAVTVSSSADAGGFGNDVILAITAGAADTVSLTFAPSNNNQWSIGDTLQSGIQVSVANGSSKLSIWLEQQLNIDSATPNCFDLYPTGDGPATAYSVTLQTVRELAAGVSKGYLASVLRLKFSAAGSATVTVSRAKIRKRL